MFYIPKEFDQKVEEILEDIRNKNNIIYSSISYAYKSGGKRIRPIFCFLCYETIKNSQDNFQDIVLSSVCVEFLHTASLMLDDVVDASDMRRGKPSVNAVFGNKVAVISGSYLIGMISKLISDIGNINLIKKFSETSSLMAEGEALEFNIMIQTSYDLSKDFVFKNYFDVINKKTASLFSLSSSIPPILYKKEDEYVQVFSKLGFLVGSAFQIKDDIIDFKPSDKTGKPSMKDLKEGKLTLPVILSENYEKIIEYVGAYKDDSDIPDEIVERIHNLVVSGDGLKRAESYLQNLSSQIYDFVDSNTVLRSRKKEFYDFVSFVVYRQF